MKRFFKTLAITASILLAIPATIAKAADYTVVANDSLYKIGQLFKVSANTIKADNSLKTNAIYPGQVLYVPSLVHTVKSGDTLYLVAKKYGISLDNLRKANNKYSNLITPGQKLNIPGVKSQSSNNTSSSSSSSSKSSSVIPYTQKELDLLARLIEAEAGGESYQAKVGVGGAVINRVQSPDWPSTITDVIYQKFGEYYQYTPVKNGMINKPASADSLKAAKEALNGSDPSKGAIFYYDNSSTNEWIRSKTVTARIDSLIFCK
jgi:N-acetylmuramoyl-L-alanine amidase